VSQLLSQLSWGETDGSRFVALGGGSAWPVGAWALWRLKRWAPWLVVIVCVLNILMYAPELTSPFMAIYAAIYIVVCALVILLVMLPNSRRPYT
jgi:uncharacterized membrane protein (DUF2068 family)